MAKTTNPPDIDELNKRQKESITQKELLAIIEQARINEWEELDLSGKEINELPLEIGNLKKLKRLILGGDYEFGNNLSKLPIEIGQLVNLEELIVGRNRLSSLPDSIEHCKNLRELNVNENALKVIPESVYKLSQLKILRIASNPIEVLSSSIANLSVLEILIAGGTKLKELPLEIVNLFKLRDLWLWGCEFSAFPLVVCQLRNLTDLSIGEFLQEIPEDICQLINLTLLNLGNNELKEFPSAICQLTNLRELDLGSYSQGNSISEIPAEIGKLTNLTRLSISSNKIKKIPSEIGLLKNLKKLNLGTSFSDQGNLLTEIPIEIGQLTNLAELNLAKNKITSLPHSLVMLEKLKELDLGNNPLNPALQSAYDQGLDAVKSYLRSLEQSEPLYEAKLVLVGEGGVGKTTLLKALSGKEPKMGELTTHGVSIDVHSMVLRHPEKEDVNIQFNAWDFGGQEVYRVTHQFFFSKRSVYLIVWEPRMGIQQGQVEDWLRLIRLRVGDDAKVIIVSTHAKTGQRIARIDKPIFLRDYGSMIVDFIEVDSLEPDEKDPNEKYNIPKLKELIATAAKDLEQMGMPFSVSWKAARDELIEIGITIPCVSFAEFSKVCTLHGLDEISIKTLAGLMHDLGYIVYYGNDERLKEDVILQPEWLTKAISFILEDRTTQERDGILPDNHLEDVWLKHNFVNEPHYNKEFFPFFLRLMEKYDVSYRLPEGDASLVAQHVPQIRPALPWQPEEEPKHSQRRLSMVCVMDEAPPGLIPWMIVRTHDYAYPFGKHSLHWQKGMFLRNKHHGEAMLELREREFLMYAEAIWPEYFMNILRQRLEKLISDNWPGLKDRFSFNVPCQNLDCDGRFEIEALREFLNDGDETIRCQDCRTKQNIVELLFGFEDYDVREQLTQIQHTVERGFLGIGDEFERLRSQIANNFLVTMKAMASEAKNGPRLFTVEPVDGKWQWINKKYCLQLWCEAEDCQHPVYGGLGFYEFKMTSEWIKQIAPYANFIIGVMKTLLPMVAPSLNLLFGSGTFDNIKYKDHLNLIQISLSSLLPEGIKAFDPGFLKDGVLTEPERSGLLALHSFLREIDPNQERIGLYRVPTYTGDFAWICKKHYDLMQPRIPEKII